jgi:hypothetical protein
MKTTLESLISTSAGEIFDTPEFRNIIEDHLTWLINHQATSSRAVTAHQIEVYDFDWIGLLQTLLVPADLHWIVIRMNGGISLTDVPQELRSILIPDYSVIQNLVLLNASTKRIS